MKKCGKDAERGTNRGKPVCVNDTDFRSTVKRNPAVLIVFGAEWCKPSNAIAPRIDELAEEYSGKVLIGKIDTDKNRKVADRYDVGRIPTLLLLKEGKVVDRIVGSVPKKTLEKAVDKAFGFESLYGTNPVTKKRNIDPLYPPPDMTKEEQEYLERIWDPGPESEWEKDKEDMEKLRQRAMNRRWKPPRSYTSEVSILPPSVVRDAWKRDARERRNSRLIDRFGRKEVVKE